MTRPNFFIVGAPKSGTTALHAYLASHPRIFMSEPKEPHYFSTDLPGFRWAHTEEDYLRFFAKAEPQHTRIGEASPLYLYSREAAANIRSFAPEAKIIVMLRSYVDYLRSYHHHTLYNRDETEASFERAWSLQGDRQEGREIPRSCREPALLKYAEVGALGAQVARVFDVFPREQVKVVFFDRFVGETRAVYEEVLAFLGLESDGRSEFPRINEAKAHRVGWLGGLLRRPPPVLLDAFRRLKRVVHLEDLHLGAVLKDLNTRSEPSAGLRPEFEAVLKAHFRADSSLLSELTGRDVTSWANA